MNKLVFILISLLLIYGCASTTIPPQSSPQATPKPQPQPQTPSQNTPQIQPKSSPICPSQSGSGATGVASYYHDNLHGNKTASGERYNKNDLTAAHKTIKFGTKVCVTNLSNSQSVIVRINDRGPFTKSRIIDLSRAAAKQIGLIRAGIAKVRVQVIR